MAEHIFLSTTGNDIARASQDLTGHWSVSSLLDGSNIRCLAADPANLGAVYAGTNSDGVLRSNDFGQNWKPAGLDGLAIRALCASRMDPNTVSAGTKPPALFITHNGGVDWQEIEPFCKKRTFWWFSPAEGRPFTPYVQAIALSPMDPDLVVVGIELGAVLRTPDGGKTWRQPAIGLDRHYGWAVAADPARPEIWYAALSPSAWKVHSEKDAQACIFRSAGGAPWQKLGGGLPEPLKLYALCIAVRSCFARSRLRRVGEWGFVVLSKPW